LAVLDLLAAITILAHGTAGARYFVGAFFGQRVAARDNFLVGGASDRFGRDAFLTGPDGAVIWAAAGFAAEAIEAAARARIGAHGFIFLNALAALVADAVARACIANAGFAAVCNAVALCDGANDPIAGFATRSGWFVGDAVAVALVELSNFDEALIVGAAQGFFGRNASGGVAQHVAKCVGRVKADGREHEADHCGQHGALQRHGVGLVEQNYTVQRQGSALL
jgi:hypothetical protein